MVSTQFALPRHPLGVRPAGNALSDARQIQRPFAQLPDEILISVLELLDTRSLLSLGATCKVLFAFSRFDELWRARMIESASVPSAWQGTWYSSYMGISAEQQARVSAEGLASDALYRPFLCANAPLAPYISQIPAANRIACFNDLTPAEFDSTWVDKPFILRGPVKEWGIFQDWSLDALLQKYSDVVFRAEAVDWPLALYKEYMESNVDESPLYLFDRAFAEKMGVSGALGGDYWSPPCFGNDLFDLLGDKRPDSRWLIVGPQRSGSTFHKDPNATSAWNAVIRGSKYWIMFPPGVSPPGVFVSEDQSEVTSPLSIAEWLLGFHKEARITRGCREGLCNTGEVLHVPSGWWHLVVNIEPSIAITQNFVPKAHLEEVFGFLKDKPDQVSGFKEGSESPFMLFKRALEAENIQLAPKAALKVDKGSTRKKRKWEELVHGNGIESSEGVSKHDGFNFGFTVD